MLALRGDGQHVGDRFAGPQAGEERRFRTVGRECGFDDGRKRRCCCRSKFLLTVTTDTANG